MILNGGHHVNHDPFYKQKNLPPMYVQLNQRILGCKNKTYMVLIVSSFNFHIKKKKDQSMEQNQWLDLEKPNLFRMLLHSAIQIEGNKNIIN